MIKYISIFRLVFRCLLVARKANLTGISTGLTGRLKNLDPTGNPTGRSTRLVPVDPTGFHLWTAYSTRTKLELQPSRIKTKDVGNSNWNKKCWGHSLRRARGTGNCSLYNLFYWVCTCSHANLSHSQLQRILYT